MDLFDDWNRSFSFPREMVMKTKPCLTLEDCRRITTACEAEAKKHNWSVTIAILDDGGHLLLLTRMDGASPITAEIATEKGRSAAVSRRSTKVSEDRIAGGRVVLLKMPVLPVQGGVPIMVEGECVGAIGVSGVQSHEDEQICNAGIAALVPAMKQ
jgi:glc operon protein GlcG